MRSGIKNDFWLLKTWRWGRVFHGEFHKVDDWQIKAFARRYDPQPFHLDDDFARQSIFGGLVASGWYTASVTMRLLVSSVPISGGLIGVGGEITCPNPTRPGDTIHAETEVVDVKPSRSRPDRGPVTLRSITSNQEGHIVQILIARLVVPRRNQPL